MDRLRWPIGCDDSTREGATPWVARDSTKLPSMDDAVFESLGFRYAPVEFHAAQAPDVRRACFRVRKVLEGVVHDKVALEGNPFTLGDDPLLRHQGRTLADRQLDDPAPSS